MTPTMADIRAQLSARFPHALPLLDAIESKMEGDTYYRSEVEDWLTDPRLSTVWLRDIICEPLRHLPEVKAIGDRFNPTTQWANTWTPLDTAIHRARHNLPPEQP